MKAFLYGILIQWKMNLRDKDMLIFYYAVPLAFYLFMSSIFSSIMPNASHTIIPSMTVFAISMGGILGSPYPLIEVYQSDIKKAYQIAHVPLWTILLTNILSAGLHLFITSLIIYGTAPFLFKALLPTNTVLYFISLCIFLITTLLAGSFFGLSVNNSSQLAIITQVLFLPSVVLSGIMFPVTLLPKFLQVANKFLPATWGFDAMCSSQYANNLFIPMFVLLGIYLLLVVWKLKKL